MKHKTYFQLFPHQFDPRWFIHVRSMHGFPVIKFNSKRLYGLVTLVVGVPYL